MSIQRWSQDLILVNLPGELENHKELQAVIAMVRDGGDCDVVVDFSQVDVVGGACLAGLLELRRRLHACGHKLTLCRVASATRGVFTVARLEDLFEFVEDSFAALASLQMIGERPPEFPMGSMVRASAAFRPPRPAPSLLPKERGGLSIDQRSKHHEGLN